MKLEISCFQLGLTGCDNAGFVLVVAVIASIWTPVGHGHVVIHDSNDKLMLGLWVEVVEY